MHLRRRSVLAAAVLMIAGCGLARAGEPTKQFTLSGGATLVSDYRFRGISQSDKNAAVQGTATLAHSSGFYVTFWGSSVFTYVTASGRSHQELDLIAGYKKTVTGTTFDLGVLYYLYPGTRLPGDRTSSNFAEPYVSLSHTFGPITAKATAKYAAKQRALALDQISRKKDNLYLAGDISTAVPKTPFGLSAHLGHTFGPSWLAIGKGYTDWNIGGTANWHALTLGPQYVDTNGTFITPSGRDAAGSGVVGSVGVSF